MKKTITDLNFKEPGVFTTLFKGKVCRGHINIKPSSAKKLVCSNLPKDYEVNNDDILLLV